LSGGMWKQFVVHLYFQICLHKQACIFNNTFLNLKKYIHFVIYSLLQQNMIQCMWKESISRRLWKDNIKKFQNLPVHDFNIASSYDTPNTNTEKICVDYKSLCCGVRGARWWCYFRKFGNTVNCYIHNVQNVTLYLGWSTGTSVWHFWVVFWTQVAVTKDWKYLNVPLALWTAAFWNKLISVWAHHCW
jgi:hypothetical protein